MNRYGRMALTHAQHHRPQAMATLAAPQAHFRELGEQIQTAVTALRDRILGAQRPGETIDGYRRRGYQALKTAEELVLDDLLWLRSEEPGTPAGDEDPVLAGYYRDLDEIAALTEAASDPG